MSKPMERKQMWKNALKNTPEQPKLDIEEPLKYLDEYEIEKRMLLSGEMTVAVTKKLMMKFVG